MPVDYNAAIRALLLAQATDGDAAANTESHTFRVSQKSLSPILAALGVTSTGGDPNATVDAHIHLMALVADLTGNNNRVQQPTRLEQIRAPGGAAANSVITISAVGSAGILPREIIVDQCWVYSPTGQDRAFLYIEPVDQTDPIEANRVVVPAVHRRTIYDGGSVATLGPTAPTALVQTGTKSNATYPQTTGLSGLATGPGEVTVTFSSTANVVAEYHQLVPRIPIGYRLVCTLSQTQNRDLFMLVSFREVQGGPVST